MIWDLVQGLHMHVFLAKLRWALYYLFIADMDLCAKYRIQNTVAEASSLSPDSEVFLLDLQNYKDGSTHFEL